MNAMKLFRSLVAPAAAVLIFAPVVLGQGTTTQPPKEPVKEPVKDAKPEAPKTDAQCTAQQHPFLLNQKKVREQEKRRPQYL